MSDKNNDQNNLDELDELHTEGAGDNFNDYESELKELEDDDSTDLEDEDIVEFDDDSTDESEDESGDEASPAPKKSNKAPILIIGTALAAFIGFGAYQVYPYLVDSEPVALVDNQLTNPINNDSKQFEVKPPVVSPVANAVKQVVSNQNLDDSSIDKNEIVLDFNAADSQLKVTEGDGGLIANSEKQNTIEIESSDRNSEIALEELKPLDTEQGQIVKEHKIEYVNDPKLEEKIDGLMAKINLLHDSMNVPSSEKERVVEKIVKVEVEKIVEVEVEKKVKRISNAEFEKLTSGRDRLKGYQVINTSKDGTMSIVKTARPGKTRVSVFFKGEKMHVSGKGIKEITGIHDSGYLAFVGSKWFMDEVYVKPIVKSPKKKATKKPVKKTKKPTVKVSKSDVVLVTPIKERAKIYENAVGWVLNAIYNDTYLIQTPTGEWLSKVDGEKLDGLGQIKGMDKNSNLIVGDYIVLLQKD